jgi:hypothetical protein
MPTTLLLVHGRSQASPQDVAADPARLEGYILARKRSWLAGLSRGLVLAGHAPVDEANAVFPFYANDFRDRIAAFEAAGGHHPELELAEQPGPEVQAVVETKADLLRDAADQLGFDPQRELSYGDPALAEKVGPADLELEKFGWGDALRVPVLRAALSFLARKTGVAAVVIEDFLTDVAYYLENAGMRDAVLDIVEDALRTKLPAGGPIVVVGHSLGTIVAYDALTRLRPEYDVRLFCTAGSPLGYPVVQKNLLSKVDGQRPRVPGCVPARTDGWVNAFDVNDVVALIHPIGPDFTAACAGQVRDERTFNGDQPHSISDYMADPDIAGPIGRALAA